MRPTRRGWVVVAAVVVSIASAFAYGPRGLNALAAPGIVALVAAGWQMYWFEPPTISRELPSRGERGSTVPVTLAFETTTPRSARIVESVERGLEASGADRRLSLGTTTVEYDLTLGARGERRVGPTTLVVRDVLGLLKRRHVYSSRDRILVHPRVLPLAGPRREALSRLYGGAAERRRAFDGLRPYQRGDPLRDVHWKSSAKRTEGDLVVVQFDAEEGDRTVEVAVESTPETADAVAEAGASIAVALHESGVGVGLQTPTGRVPPDDPDGRLAILDHLAVAEAGELPRAGLVDADVLVRGNAGGVTVHVDGSDHEFSALAGPAVEPEVAGVR